MPSDKVHHGPWPNRCFCPTTVLHAKRRLRVGNVCVVAGSSRLMRFELSSKSCNPYCASPSRPSDEQRVARMCSATQKWRRPVPLRPTTVILMRISLRCVVSPPAMGQYKGVRSFAQAVQKSVKPLIGADYWEEPDSEESSGVRRPWPQHH